MTAPTFRAVASATDIGGGNIVINKPTGTLDYAGGATSDWMLGIVGCSGVQAITTVPSGWTEIATGKVNIRAWYKRPSAEGANYTWATTGGGNPRVTVGFIYTLKDGDPNLPPTIGSVRDTLASVSCTAPGLTPGPRAALILEIGFSTDTTLTAVSATPPPGMKERVDIQDSQLSGTNAQAHVHASEGYVLPYGATQDRVATLNSAKDNSGFLVVFYQVPLTAGVPDGSGKETLIELTHWDEIAGAETVKKYSSRGVTFTGGEQYEPRILSGVEISQQAADRAAVGGIVATTISTVKLNNKDGTLSALAARGLAIGRTCVVRVIPVTRPGALSDLGAGIVANAVTVFSGIVGALTPDGDDMLLAVSDLTERLNVPLQASEYDGSAGFGGGAEKKGLTKPACFGRVYNILPEQLGTIGGLESFQIHSRANQDIGAVYIRGVAQTDATPGPPGAGQYNRLGGSGGFELGASPDGDVTCTAKGDSVGSYPNQHGEIIDRMLKDFGPLLTAGEVESSTFTAVDTILPGEIGIFFPAGDRSTTRDAIARVLSSGGIWFAGGRNGKVRLAMAMPVAAERLRLTEPDIVALRPLPLPSSLQPAPTRIEVATEKNWHPLANIAGSVTGATRRKLAGPGRTVESVSALLEARQKIKRSWPIDALWFNDNDGQTRADQIRAWIETGLTALEVVTDRYLNQVELGMGCEIDSYSRFGLQNGFAGIVAGWREAPGKGRVALTLIGAYATDPNELREDGQFELREDGTEELRE